MLTREQLIELARQSGFAIVWYQQGDKPCVEEIWGGRTETAKLIRFASLVQAATATDAALEQT